MVLENELNQDPADEEEVYVISCYEMDEEGRDDGSDTVRVESRKLPIVTGSQAQGLAGLAALDLVTRIFQF